MEKNIKYRLSRIMVTLLASQTPKYTRRFLTVKVLRVFTGHCVIYGVESWSGVLAWSHGVESWSGFWSGFWSGMKSDLQ